jgi:hypothetical protein
LLEDHKIYIPAGISFIFVLQLKKLGSQTNYKSNEAFPFVEITDTLPFKYDLLTEKLQFHERLVSSYVCNSFYFS